MNTGTAVAESIDVEVNTGTLHKPEQDTKSLEVRWGFQMSQREKPLSSQNCGLAAAPFGQLFPIKTFFTPRENHTIDWTQPKEKIVTITAAEAELHMMEALGGLGAQTRVNWGLKTAFLGETDAGKMALFNAILMPTLSRMREIGEALGMPAIENACPGSDDLDFGQRETCVSCAFAWLQSKTLDAYIDQCSQQQFQINERDRETGETSARSFTPSARELRSAREVMLESAKLGTTALRAQWNEIAAEYEKADGFRKDISEVEHGYRKDLHQSRPQDRQINLAKAMAQGASQQSSGSNDELMRMLVQSNIKMEQMLGQVIAGGAGVQATINTPVEIVPIPVEVESSTGTAGGVTTASSPNFAERMKQAKANKQQEK